MARSAVQRARGTAAHHEVFAGLLGEVTVNTTTKNLHVHDGSKLGGYPTSHTFNVVNFGALGDGTTNDTAAIQAAIDSAESAGGGEVEVPPGSYSITQITIPANVQLVGHGQRATEIKSGIANDYAIIAGTASGQSYGVAIRDLTLRLTSNTTLGIALLCTVGAHLENLYLEGNLHTSQASTGVTIDGQNVGSWFTTLINVNCNHMFIGFAITGGTENATSVWAQGCNSYGDVNYFPGRASIGLLLYSGGGHGSVWMGGNFENCGQGIKADTGAPPMTFVGTRFEANTTDIFVHSAASVQNFLGCNGIQTTSLSAVQNFIGCTKETAYAPLANSMAELQIDARADANVPLVARGFSLTQSADLFQCKRSDGTVKLSVNSNGDLDTISEYPVIYKIGGFADPNGNITAQQGSVYLYASGGAGVTLWVKETGTGNTGWVAK
jgi:hypothetical protein